MSLSGLHFLSVVGVIHSSGADGVFLPEFCSIYIGTL